MTQFNTPITVDGSGFAPINITKLSSTLALCAYSDGVSGNTVARTITISASGALTANAVTANFGSSAGGSDQMALVALSSTSAILVHGSGANMEARYLTVSGTTVTVNSPTTLTRSSSVASDIDIAKIDSTKGLYVCETTSPNGVEAVVLSVSGTAITENTIVAVGAAANKFNTQCSVYSTTKSIVTYVEDTTNRAQGAIVDISGTTLTANTEKYIDTYTVSPTDGRHYNINLTGTKAVVGYSDTVGAGDIDRVSNVLTLNGTTFNVGTVARDDLTVDGSLAAAALSTTQFITVTETSSNDMRSLRYSESGAALTAESSDTLALSSLTYIEAAQVDSDRIVVIYIDSNGVSAVTVNAVYTFSGYDLVLGGGQP